MEYDVGRCIKNSHRRERRHPPAVAPSPPNVLWLEARANKWIEAWYVPPKCWNVQMKDFTCECGG